MTAPAQPQPDRSASPAQALGLLIAIGGPALVIWLRNGALALSPLVDQRVMSTTAFVAITVLVLLWVAVAEQKPLASVGLPRIGLSAVAWGLGAGVIFAALLIGADLLLSQLFPASPAPIDQLMFLPLWLRLAMLVGSSWAEELLFVAYPLTRLQALTGSRAAAALISFAVFVGVHLPGRGPAALLDAALAGALFLGLFLWRRNLWTNTVAHIAVDFVPLLVLPAIASLHR